MILSFLRALLPVNHAATAFRFVGTRLKNLFFPGGTPHWKRLTMLLLGMVILSVASVTVWIVHHRGAISSRSEIWERPFDF
jgi:hypothetical protein